MVNDTVFTGKKDYAFRKSRELYKRGWVVVSSKRWSDGSYTFTMRFVGQNKVG